MDTALQFLERLTPAGFAGLAAGTIGLPVVGTLLVSGAADVGLTAIAMGAGAAAGWGAWYRRRVSTLPLEIAPVALVGRLDGHPVYRFRLRLGHGRPMHDARAEVSFVGPAGETPLAPVLGEAPTLLGPWTLAVVDRAHAADGPGSFRVRAEVTEGGRTWRAERTWPREALRPGRFAPAVRIRHGRLEWEGPWDAVREEA